MQNQLKIIIGCTKGALLIWNLQHKDFPSSQKCFVALYGHTNHIFSLREVAPEDNQGTPYANKIISLSYDKTLRVWDIGLEICCFVVKMENKIDAEVLNLNKSHSAFIENEILDLENYCVKFKIGISSNFKNSVFTKKRKTLIYFNEKEQKIIEKNIFNYSDCFLCFNELKRNKNDIEMVIKENLQIYPFNFNILHILAVVDDLNEIEMKNFD